MTARSGLWVRDGEDFVNARSAVVTRRGGIAHVELGDVRVYSFGADGALARLLHAKGAVFDGRAWVLDQVRITTLDAQGTRAVTRARMDWPTAIDPQVLAKSVVKPQYLAVQDLLRNIRYLEANGQAPGSYAVAFWARVLYPLNVLVLVLCAMPFAFGALRSGGLGKRMFIGILLALAWYFLQQGIVNFGTVYGLPPFLANLLPALLLVAASWAWFRRRL